MRIETTRFGEVDIAEESILHMPDGMLGFECYKRFVLLEDKPGVEFKWLQAVDNPALAFIVIDPMAFFPDYEMNLTDEEAESLDIRDASEAVVLTTVTVNKEEGKVTANLLGPVVINSRTLQARQIVLQDDRYGTKHIIGEVPRADSKCEPARAA